MENDSCSAKARFIYPFMTEEVIAKAKKDRMLEELIVAVVHAAADYDMYATGKANPDNDDYRSSYGYFRDIINRLGVPPQAIVDAINECFPDDPRDNLTESDDDPIQASTS